MDLSQLTDDQLRLLRLLAELHQSGRKSEFIISRTFGSSDLVFLGGGENVEIDFDNSDFLALQNAGLIGLHSDSRGDLHGKITGTGLKAANESLNSIESTLMNKRDVFVIHGRNKALRRAMFDFLRSIGLRPLEWDDLIANTVKGSPYMGDVLEAGLKQAAAVIGFLTPDDIVFLNPQLLSEDDRDYERKPTAQARPNVLFELGMAFALQPDRTVIVEVGDLRPFSDIGGRHTVKFDNSPAARTSLRSRLKTAGCEVVEHGTDWLTAGDFSVTLPTVEVDIETRRTNSDASANAKDISSAQRRAYGLAILILRKLKGEFYENNGLPGYLWSTRYNWWEKIASTLGKTNPNNGRFEPYTEPSIFDETDEGTIEAAAEILGLYLWAAKNNADFERIKTLHSLPEPSKVEEYVALGKLPRKYE